MLQCPFIVYSMNLNVGMGVQSCEVYYVLLSLLRHGITIIVFIPFFFVAYLKMISGGDNNSTGVITVFNHRDLQMYVQIIDNHK